MSEEDTKDFSPIKLFGQTIGLQQMSPDITDTATEQRQSSSDESTSQHTKRVPPTDSDRKSPTSSSEKTDEPVESQENTALKKPDKLLPCPRCKSPDTKFCYYNNYNIKQPRHFCKNCQRYWTSGGTMREVPVGSGRRKRKDMFSSEHHRRLKVLDAPTSGFFIFCNDHRGLDSSGFPFAFYQEPNTHRSLRIDDPRKAAKSSVWSTLGKKEKIGSANKMCLFEAFETKGDRNWGADNATIALQANPAAFSRSLKFHEHA